MINRPFILFLLANFIVGIFLLTAFKNKAADKNNDNAIVEKSEDIPIEKMALNTTSITKNNNFVPVIETPSVCMEYGPLDIEQKSIVDNILNKEKVVINKDKRNQYEVYWNLGTNEEQAKEMFAKQKQAALQDNKFQMTKSENFWIVSITVVNDSVDTAKSLAAQLSEKANKVNAGGRWQYRTLPEAYYYQVKDINALSPSSLTQLTKGLGLSKKPCEA